VAEEYIVGVAVGWRRYDDRHGRSAPVPRDRIVLLELGLEHGTLPALLADNLLLDMVEQVAHANHPVGTAGTAAEPVQQVPGEHAVAGTRHDVGITVAARCREHRTAATLCQRRERRPR